jgi:hypothetical protein
MMGNAVHRPAASRQRECATDLARPGAIAQPTPGGRMGLRAMLRRVNRVPRWLLPSVLALLVITVLIGALVH